ncbi:hypothetical protein BHE74_00049589, partial [Ensete ventricosum]
SSTGPTSGPDTKFRPKQAGSGTGKVNRVGNQCLSSRRGSQRSTKATCNVRQAFALLHQRNLALNLCATGCLKRTEVLQSMLIPPSFQTVLQELGKHKANRNNKPRSTLNNRETEIWTDIESNRNDKGGGEEEKRTWIGWSKIKSTVAWIATWMMADLATTTRSEAVATASEGRWWHRR